MDDIKDGGLMNNNDIIIALRDSLDISQEDMVKIFSLGGKTLTKDDVMTYLKYNKSFREIEGHSQDGACDYPSLEMFLNGLIVFKRGPKDDQPKLTINNASVVNNAMLKKVKIAMSLSSEDVQEIFELGGIEISASELTTFYRKKGHKHYKKCNDLHADAFLKGLHILYQS